MQAQTITPAGWIKVQLNIIPAGAEVRRVTQPQTLTVVRNKLAREIQKISLNDTNEISPGEVIQSFQTRFGMHYSLEIEAIMNRLEKVEARLSCV